MVDLVIVYKSYQNCILIHCEYSGDLYEISLIKEIIDRGCLLSTWAFIFFFNVYILTNLSLGY